MTDEMGVQTSEIANLIWYLIWDTCRQKQKEVERRWYGEENKEPYEKTRQMKGENACQQWMSEAVAKVNG